MAPGPLTKKRTAVKKGDADDGTSDVASVSEALCPPVSVKLMRHSDTDSDAVAAREKRAKLGSPSARRARTAALVNAEKVVEAPSKSSDVFESIWGRNKDTVAARTAAQKPVDETGITTMTDATDAGGITNAAKRSKKKAKLNAVEAGTDPVTELKAITGELMEVVLVESVDRSVARLVSSISARYEVLMMKLIAENERLKGRLESGAGCGPFIAPVAVPAAPARRTQVRSEMNEVREKFPVLPKPVETWSVVVKGKDAASSKEVVDKVVKEVGPTLGVRVHGVRPIKTGGAVIRTPSVVERERIRANAKFAEVGLEVSVNDKIGQKVVVQRVHAEISPDEFMLQLYELNFKETMSEAEFGRSVRLVSAPWRVKDGECINVTLECTGKVVEQLRTTGAYIKWFRFQVRAQDVVQTCFRCLGFGHWVQECRMREDTCRRCGVAGHRASACRNEARCRDCEFKGFPADHRMLSMACPVYEAMVARVNSRH